MRNPMMSGHCSTPSTSDPESSHDRCRGGQSANPDKEFVPCPCPCHHGETYECGNCARPIVEMPEMGVDDDGDPFYYHVDVKSGRATSPECA